jgi:hypothetical protein
MIGSGRQDLAFSFVYKIRNRQDKRFEPQRSVSGKIVGGESKMSGFAHPGTLR